jgi:hypothetical protein
MRFRLGGSANLLEPFLSMPSGSLSFVSFRSETDNIQSLLAGNEYWVAGAARCNLNEASA